jgi:hypothetical protein
MRILHYTSLEQAILEVEIWQDGEAGQAKS